MIDDRRSMTMTHQSYILPEKGVCGGQHQGEKQKKIMKKRKDDYHFYDNIINYNKNDNERIFQHTSRKRGRYLYLQKNCALFMNKRWAEWLYFLII